ncbi:MAG: hypothetical protein CXR31_06105 [Geobacter sp.]|nr:MAG: hypothetical protein CXR31_06105 [Geobacter sp.]
MNSGFDVQSANSTSQISECKLRYLLLLIYLVVVFRLWIMPLGASLWLDETLTYWNVMKGVSHVFERSAACAGQFQLYMFITALSTKFFGLNEFGLRLPSIIASIGSSWLIFRIGQKFSDTETGIFTAILFVCIPQVYLYASNARPYALVILCSLWALWQLIKLHDTGNWRHVAGYSVAAASMVYMHYISATFLIVLVFYSVLKLKRTVAYKVFWANFALIVLITPLLLLIFTTSKDTAIISFVDTPTISELIKAVISSYVITYIIILLACKVFLRNKVRHFLPLYDTRITFFVTLWLFLPIVTCYIVSIVSDYKIFVDRYYIISYSGLALLLASALQKIRHTMFRHMALISLCVISVSTFGVTPSNHSEDWRGALAAVKTIAEPMQIPIFFNSGLVETLQPNWEHQSADDHLLSPLSAYPVKTRVIPLPPVLNAKSTPYLASKITNEISSQNRFIVVLRRLSNKNWVDKWIQEYSIPRGFERREVGPFQGVIVVLYEQKKLT